MHLYQIASFLTAAVALSSVLTIQVQGTKCPNGEKMSEEDEKMFKIYELILELRLPHMSPSCKSSLVGMTGSCAKLESMSFGVEVCIIIKTLAEGVAEACTDEDNEQITKRSHYSNPDNQNKLNGSNGEDGSSNDNVHGYNMDLRIGEAVDKVWPSLGKVCRDLYIQTFTTCMTPRFNFVACNKTVMKMPFKDLCPTEDYNCK